MHICLAFVILFGYKAYIFGIDKRMLHLCIAY